MVSRSERGSALIIAIATLAMVALAVAAASSLIGSRADSVRLTSRDVRVGALVDAAMAETLARLASDDEFDGFPTRPFGAGAIAATVDRSHAPQVRVVAVGTLGEWRGEIEAEVLVPIGGMPVVDRWTRRFALTASPAGVAGPAAAEYTSSP